MASIVHCLFLLKIFLALSSSESKTSFRPKSLLLNVTKDSSTLQYITQINQRTPLVPVTLTLDLGGQFMWSDCDTGYVSSTYRPVRCGSAQCNLSKSNGCVTECSGRRKPGCNNNTCAFMPDNTVTRTGTLGDLGSDVVAIQSTDGTNPGRVVTVPRFLAVCGSVLRGLANGVVGMAGLGRTRVSLPYQFSSAFSFRKVFAICLSSSTSSPGVVFFGDGPYRFLLNTDASSNLVYTPLIKNPVSTASMYSKGDASSEYFIGVKSIKINGKEVRVNKTLLSIDKEGYGGTKISTVHPYTVLHPSIHKAVVDAFAKSLKGVPKITPVSPFSLCFNSTSLGSTRVGPGVPPIDLVLQNKKVFWRIFGANSMVQVKKEVSCLGFVENAVFEKRTSIIIGGHQIEDNLLQFDLARSRLGFSSSLLFRQTTCANFNYTLNA